MGQVRDQVGQFGQHHLGDEGQIQGARLSQAALSCKLNGRNIAELSAMEVGALIPVLQAITDPVANITAGVRYMIDRYGVDTVRAGGRSSVAGNYLGY